MPSETFLSGPASALGGLLIQLGVISLQVGYLSNPSSILVGAGFVITI